MEDKISLAIEFANDMREENNEKARELIEMVSKDINISQYNDLNNNVMVIISVRVGKDILSTWGASELISTRWYWEYDLYKAKLNSEFLCNSGLEDLNDFQDE